MQLVCRRVFVSWDAWKTKRSCECIRLKSPSVLTGQCIHSAEHIQYNIG